MKHITHEHIISVLYFLHYVYFYISVPIETMTHSISDCGLWHRWKELLSVAEKQNKTLLMMISFHNSEENQMTFSLTLNVPHLEVVCWSSATYFAVRLEHSTSVPAVGTNSEGEAAEITELSLSLLKLVCF